MNRDELLQEARTRLHKRGFTTFRSFKDKGGVYAYIMHKRPLVEQQFYLVAKHKLYEPRDSPPLASFIQKIVRRADDHDGWLLLYHHSESEFWVFDSEYVRENAEDSTGKSKSHTVDWYELPIDHGTRLDPFLGQNERPDTIDDTRPTGLDRWS